MRIALVGLALLKLALRLEAGPEYDTNANHVETPAPLPAGTDPNVQEPTPIPSFLVRATARGRLLYTRGHDQLRLTLDAGGKLFFAEKALPQDVLVLRLQGDYRHDFGWFSVGLGLDYHDAEQPIACPVITDLGENGLPRLDTSCHRDFRLGGARASLTLQDRIPSLTAEFSARGYEWKPDEDLSFAALAASLTPGFSLHIDKAGEHQISGWMMGRLERRYYLGRALPSETYVNQDNSLPYRTDNVATLSFHLGYLGAVLAGLDYWVETDRSTTFGGSYLYQAVAAELQIPLPRGFTVGGRAQLLAFASGALPPSLWGEDENRDAVVGEVARDFGHGITLRLRYAWFHSDAPPVVAGSPAPTTLGYERQVGSLLLGWQIP